MHFDNNEMQCTDHPHRNNPAGGGICAFCLQEKLGKLVSSSFPPPPSASSPSSPPSLSVKTYTRSRLPFPLPKKQNKKKPSSSANVIFKRSMSTATPTRNKFLDDDDEDIDLSPRKRNGFWSFLYPSHKDKSLAKRSDHVIMEEDTDTDTRFGSSSSSLVSRSRSVGCGSRSRSFSGDCTLRRVESQREGKPKACMKERVRCGGIFGAFIMTWVDDGRGWSWGWAFASPIRAFGGKVSSSKRNASDKNAIPSLLTVRG